MKEIEVFTELTAPPLYDFFIDRQGVYTPMDNVPPPAEGITQVVCEGETLNSRQLVAISVLARKLKAEIHYFTEAPSY